MTEADKLLLENFFADRLSAAERAAVAERVATDAAFAEAFRERQRMENYLSYRAQGGATPELLNQLGAEAFGAKKKAPIADEASVVPLSPRRPGLSWIAAAAAVLLLVMAGWWIFSGRLAPDPQELYAAYAESYPLSGTTMGPTADSLRSIFEPRYNAGEYAAALPALDAYLEQEPTDGEVRLARGRARLETGQLAAAEADFQILANSTTAFRDEGQWWYALAALKVGALPAARERLRAIPASSSRYGRAQELLGEL